MNIYSPLFTGFSSEYANAFNEERSTEEQAALKKQYVETLETEHRVNTDRLDAMKRSVALKEPTLKSSFDQYDSAYRAVVSYYKQYTVNVSNVTEAIAGKCRLNADLNIASSTLGKDYTKAADDCLTALGEAKKTSDEPTKKLLTDMEKLVKERRDAFSQTMGKEGLIETATKMAALASLLTINGELQEIQQSYNEEVKAEYEKLVNQANESNKSLEKALKPFVGDERNEA